MQQVLDAVDTLHPAIEIPDSSFSDFVNAGAAQIIADNACAHLFVLGAPTKANWRALDLVEEKTGHHARAESNSSVTARTCSAIPGLPWHGSPMNCGSLGITLRAGEIVTTGTCHPPLPINPAISSPPISV